MNLVIALVLSSVGAVGYYNNHTVESVVFRMLMLVFLALLLMLSKNACDHFSFKEGSFWYFVKWFSYIGIVYNIALLLSALSHR